MLPFPMLLWRLTICTTVIEGLMAEKKLLFQKMKGYQLQNILSDLKGVRSSTECMVKCTEMDSRHGCISISYNKANNRCLLSDSIVPDNGSDAGSTLYFILPALTSYTYLPSQYMYLGSGIDDNSNNMVHSVSDAEQCYRHCFNTYGFNCKLFTYGSDLCSFPKQDNPIQYLSNINISSTDLYDSYFLFSSEERDETFPSDSYSTLTGLCIRDGRSDNSYEMKFCDVEDLNACYRLCLEIMQNCVTFSYNPTSEDCYLTTANFHDDWTYVESISGCTGYFLKDQDKWKLMTKHWEYRGALPDDAYNQDRGFQQKAADGDLQYSYTNSNHTYLKNQLIDYWDSITSKNKIRMELRLTYGSLLKYLEYSAVGTTRTNWYSSTYFLSSSYTDLTSAGTYNTWEMSDTRRTFYISHHHGGCGGDSGWVQISATANFGCTQWDLTTTLPMFLYAPGSTYTTWSSGKAHFEVLLIYMSFN